jgi:hypothetical protein
MRCAWHSIDTAVSEFITNKPDAWERIPYLGATADHSTIAMTPSAYYHPEW